MCVGFFDGLGDDADIADDGHEINVAVPARDDVAVDVAGDACAGALADVEADVVALGVHGEGEGLLAEGEEFHDLGAFIGGEFDGGWGVAIGGDEQVAVDVGEFVEHEEAEGGAGEDEVGLVLFGVLGGFAEEAVGWAVGDGFDVFESPGGVEELGHEGEDKGKRGKFEARMTNDEANPNDEWWNDEMGGAHGSLGVKR